MQYLVAIKMQYNCRYFLCTSIYKYVPVGDEVIDGGGSIGG